MSAETNNYKFSFGTWDDKQWLKDNDVKSLVDLKSNPILEKKYLEDFEKYQKQQLSTWDKNYKDTFKKDYISNQSPWRKPLIPFYFSNTIVDTNKDPDKTLVEKPINDKWLAIAQENGFNTLDDIKNFQRKFGNGLVVDGKYGPATAAAYKWYKENKDKNYTEIQGNGNIEFIDGNGLIISYQTKPEVLTNKSNYILNTSKYTVDDILKTNNFRRPYGLNYNVSIDGIRYPVIVTKGNGFKNLENDHSYAYDAKTNRVRKLKENMFGSVSQVGNYGQFADDSSWISLNDYMTNYKFKQGGKMNKIKYFQQGGAAPQQDLQQQVIALVQAAMQGDQQATQQVNQIMESAKTGDPQATQIAQMIQQVVQQMQGQATSAKWGAKLRYIQSLKYAKGGKTCPECEKKKIEEKKCGGKAKKRYFGGIL